MGQPALPDDWHHHFPPRDGCWPDCHLRLPRHPTAYGPYDHTSYADFLTDSRESRRDDGVCRVLLRLSLRSATWTYRGGVGEPGTGHGRGRTWAVSCAGEVAGRM